MREGLRALLLGDGISRGASVAIATGSRSIARLPEIVRGLVSDLRDVGARPFIVPAMGSHGGATADGQVAVLAGLGITEATVGAPIVSSMDVVTLGETASGLPVHFDRHAAAADFIFAVNRVAPHSEFSGSIGSGIMKMLSFGLGKRVGVERYHREAFCRGYESVIRELTSVVLDRVRVAGGVAVIEDAQAQLADVHIVAGPDIVGREPALFLEAKARLQALPFSTIDLLIVDELGKDFSGAGMSPWVTGRGARERFPDVPSIARIYVRRLSPKSLGNASGIGLADFASQRVVDDMDRATTYVNCLAAQVPEYARIPVIVANDQDAYHAALRTIGAVEPEAIRAVWIRNTKQLSEMLVSEALAREAQDNPALEVSTRATSLAFDGDGELPSFQACFGATLA